MRRSAALLLTAVLAACSGDSTPADGSGPIVFASDDVHLMGSSESIGEVRDLAVDSDGSVWVLNSTEPFFVEFDPAGAVVEAYGRQGGGPEEFPMPAGFVSQEMDGAPWVFDFVRHAFFRVSADEGARTEVRVPRDQVPVGTVRGGMSLMTNMVRTARLGDELVFPWTTGTLSSGISSYHMSLLQADMAALDPKTGEVRPVLSLGERLEDPSVGFVATDGGFPLWYRLWAVCGNDIRVYDRVRNQLRGFSADGAEVAPVDLPPVQLTSVTPVEFARATFLLRQAEATGGVGDRLSSADSVNLVNETANSLDGSGEELAAYLPRFVDFRCADDGGMWLQPVDLVAGGMAGSSTWLRVTADGDAREVRLPPRFDAKRFEMGRIWGVQRDELDVAAVAWIAFDPGASR